MEKTIKINLAGVIFQINEDGFEILRDYLQTITNRLKNIQGGNEMIDDIEARISEIFQAGPSWKTGIISKEDVEDMIKTMGTADEIAGDMEGEYSYEKRNYERRMFRDPDQAIIGGVCSGLGNYLRIDPVWIRILFVIFSIVYLSGVFIYIVLWIALPKATLPHQGRDISSYRVSDDDATLPAERRHARHTAPETDHPVRKVGNAFNEIFKAFGKFFVILFRIILAIIGVSFIITGFSFLFSFIIIAFFNSNAVMGNVFDTGLFHLPDFLSFIVNPSLTPWLLVMSSIVIILPLLAIIYWGIRMVFQFRVRDLILNIVMLVVWIMSATALAGILFSEGISFSDNGRTYEQIPLPQSDTLFIRLDTPVSSLRFDRTVTLPFEKSHSTWTNRRKRFTVHPKLTSIPSMRMPHMSRL
ncbi:MAG: PspC domain-containing protein [Bacteroidales bacterium]